MPRRRPLSFYKMHSLGNDFMVIDGVSSPFDADAELIEQWAQRNTGIGFDQLLTIEPPTEPDADFLYRIYNADGREAEQCGNGTRCVALLVRQLGLCPKPDLVWQSLAGRLHTHIGEDGQIQTEMTRPQLEAAQVPFAPEGIEVCERGAYAQYLLQTERATHAVTPVSMGNPHAVLFLDDIFNADVSGIGAELTAHPAYPNGANVGFCQVIDRHFVRLRVYERGVGETLACGSGACAAVVAARLHGMVDERVKVSLPGGKLRIAWPGPGEPVKMSGGATLVYRGELQREQ